MNTTKINNIVIKKINLDNNNMFYTYNDIFNLPYFNLIVNAQTQSGKTNIIYNLLIYNLIHKIPRHPELNTIVYFFVSTINQDKLYIKLIKKLDKMNIEYKIYDDNYNLEEDIYIMNKEQIDKKELFNNQKKKYKQLIYPLSICVFDDFNIKSNRTIVYDYLKKSRHNNTINIISIQNYKKIDMASRENMNYMLLLNSNKTYLKEIYEDYMPTDTYNEFINIYEYIKEQSKYNFLFLNRSLGKEDFRINFNEKINI